MGRKSGEQARRRFVSTLPALLTSKCVRRCVASGLLPTAVYRAKEPTPEFNSNYFKNQDDHATYVRRHLAWKAKGKPPSKSQPIRREPSRSRKVRIANKIDLLMRLQKGRCYLCSEPFQAARSETLEHVVPRAMGGRSHRNVLLAHGDCNQEKADRLPRPCERIYLAAINLRRYSESFGT